MTDAGFVALSRVVLPAALGLRRRRTSARPITTRASTR
jgi:hypothetical protein